MIADHVQRRRKRTGNRQQATGNWEVRERKTVDVFL